MVAAVAVDTEDTYAFEGEPSEFWSYASIRGWVMYLPGLSNTAFRLYCKLRSMIAHGSPRTLRKMTVDQVCWLMTNPGEKPVSKSTAKNALRELRHHELIIDMDGNDSGREFSGPRRYRVKELPPEGHLGVRNSWDWLDAYTNNWRDLGGQFSAPLTNPDNPRGVKSDKSTTAEGEGVRKLTPGGQKTDQGGQNSVADPAVTCANEPPYKAPSLKPVPSSSSSSSSSSVGIRGRGNHDNAAPPREDEEEEMMTTLDGTTPGRPTDATHAPGEEPEMADSGWLPRPGHLPDHLAQTGEVYFTGRAALPTTQYRPRPATRTPMAVEGSNLPKQARREISKSVHDSQDVPRVPAGVSIGAAERLGSLWENERARYGYTTTKSVQSKIVRQSRAHLAAGEQEAVLATALRSMAARRTWLCLDKHLEYYVPPVQASGGLSADQIRAVAGLRALAAKDGTVNWARLEEWRADHSDLLASCGWVGDAWDTGLSKAGIVWVSGRGNVLMDM